MAPTPPTVTVIDLTARLGLFALAQLGVSSTAGPGPWRQVPLATTNANANSSPLFDWLRPTHERDLETASPASAATILLVGPGSANLVRAALAWLRPRATAPLWVFVMPNAIVEDAVLRAATPAQMAHTQVYRLPDSAPQTFWFILMEQLNQLSAIEDLARETTPVLLPTDTVRSNLKQCMDDAMAIAGAQAVALVDYRSGMCLAQAGGGINLELAAAGNAEVVRAKFKTMDMLGLRRSMEDILITLDAQYHLIRLVPTNAGLFLYLVLDKARGNLALARYQLTEIERTLQV
jgi:hypothetical protein